MKTGVMSVNGSRQISELIGATWIHVASVDSIGRAGHYWWSPAREIEATQEESETEYCDQRARVLWKYDAEQQVLYRVPGASLRRADHFASILMDVRASLQGEKPIERPLEELAFLVPAEHERKIAEVIEQTVEKAADGGREWLDYRLTVRIGDNPEPIEFLFRVARETKLLHFQRFAGSWDGISMSWESRFEYLDQGPADIYDLGVPRTTKMVDRTPSQELTRILEAQREDRLRMDNYRAFMILRSDAEAPRSWRSLEITYRKGHKFRRDYATWKSDEMRLTAWRDLPEDGNMVSGLRNQMERFYSHPMSITCGSAYEYRIDWRNVFHPDGSYRCMEVEAVRKVPAIGGLDLFLPIHWSLTPEFACRPPMGIPSQGSDPVLDMAPKDGPPGTILLNVQYVQEFFRGSCCAGSRGSGSTKTRIPVARKYWLDPARNYVAVRMDMIDRVQPGNEELVDTSVVEELVRSPQGVWFATRVRRLGAARSEGATSDQVMCFYVDFDVDLPDSAFEPPKVGARVEETR